MPTTENNSEQTKKSMQNLSHTIRDTIVVLEADSCCHPAFVDFLNNCIPILANERKQIAITDAAINDLARAQKNAGRNEELIKSNWQMLNHMINLGAISAKRLNGSTLIDVLNSPGVTDFTVITQNDRKAHEYAECGRGRKVIVKQINKYGFLSPHKIIPYKKFHVVDTAHMYKGPFNVPKVSENYLSTSTVYIRNDSGKPVPLKIGSSIADGGEGDIYPAENNPEVLIKIFKTHDVTPERLFYSCTKVKLLLESGLRLDNVAFPLGEVMDENGNLIGYAMRKVYGISLSDLLIGSQNTIREFFGQNVDRHTTVKLCLSLLKVIKSLHDQGIIIGDVRPENIIVNHSGEVTIIDTDSFQINEYPCAVGVPLYTPPERISDDYTMIEKSKYMGTVADDIFAVISLVFQIMMPGKEPYAQQDGADDMLKAIKLGDFPYPNGKDSTNKAPRGNWRFCWSHLPVRIKTMMYETFNKDSEHYPPDKRYTIEEWISAFSEYYNNIMNGRVAKIDPKSLELIPNRFKKSKYGVYGVCKNMGNGCELDIVDQKDLDKYHGYCYRCANQIIEEYECPQCHANEIVYRFIDQLNGREKPKMCRDCKKKTVIETRHCVECHKPFDITEGMRHYYVEEKGWELPKRCPECSRKLKENKKAASNRGSNAGRTSNASTESNFWTKFISTLNS